MIYEVKVRSSATGEEREVREDDNGEERSRVVARVLRRRAFEGFDFDTVEVTEVSPEAALAQALIRIESLQADLAALREINGTLTAALRDKAAATRWVDEDDIRRVLAGVVMAKPCMFPKGFRTAESAVFAFCAPEDILDDIVAAVEEAMEREDDTEP